MKQRLVGAAVLVALAVIFLPMLLDGSGRPDRVDVSMEIPEEPEITTTPAGSSGAERDSGTGAPTGSGSPDRQADSADEPAAGVGSDVRVASDQGEASPPTDPARSANGDETGSGDAAPSSSATAEPETDDAGSREEGSEEAQSGPSAWVVQVGSFARETNGLVLRDRLREQGFDAFTDTGEADGQRVWRVRIGPVATRAEAEELERALERKRDAPALIMSYPE